MAKTPKTEIDEDLVRKLAALLDETGLTEIEYGRDGLNVRVAKNGGVGPAVVQAPTPVAHGAAPAEPAEASAAADLSDHPGAITSPMVGMAYTSPDPNSPPFVQVGDEVSQGQTLLLIEAMKVFNPITAPKAGRVASILVDNGTPVEFGEPLLILE